MAQMKRAQLLTDIVNVIVNRQRLLMASDLSSSINYWRKQFDIDTPLINDIIRQTEEYTAKFLGGKGCLIFFWICVTIICCFLFGGYGLFMGIMCLGYALTHTTPVLFGKDINEKEVALNKIIERKITLETNLKKHIAAGSTIPEEFANSVALNQAKKILDANPTLTAKELFSLLREKRDAYNSTLTPKQKRVLAQLPYQIKSYYIFMNGKAVTHNPH